LALSFFDVNFKWIAKVIALFQNEQNFLIIFSKKRYFNVDWALFVP